MSINVTHLLNLQLAGFSNDQVAAFVEQVKFCKAAIPPEDLKEIGILYNWLWEKFKNYTRSHEKLLRSAVQRLTATDGRGGTYLEPYNVTWITYTKIKTRRVLPNT